jgi:hypothetical protein
LGKRQVNELRHVVISDSQKLRPPATVAEIIRRFAELKELVPGLNDFEWGKNFSPEGLDHGHSHVFLVTFSSAQARDAYLVHPDHAAFANWVQPFVSSVTVLDYRIERAKFRAVQATWWAFGFHKKYYANFRFQFYYQLVTYQNPLCIRDVKTGLRLDRETTGAVASARLT